MAKAGTPPAFAKRPFAFASSPQVFHLSETKNEIVVKMVPTTSCRIKVLGPDGNPVAGAICRIWPDVQWWDGGSSGYCAPERSTAEALRGQLLGDGLWEQVEQLFAATTDADGIAVVENLPVDAQEELEVLHEDLELPLDDAKQRIRNVELKAGRRTEVTVKLQKKRTEFIGSNLRAASDKSPEELAEVKEQEAAAVKHRAIAKQFDTADAAYAALAEQYDAEQAAYIEALNNPGSDDERVKAGEKRVLALDYAPRFFAIAEEHPDDPAAIDALTWIASHCMYVDEGKKSLQILARKYSESEQIAAYVGVARRYGEPFAPFEEFLRAVLKNNPQRKLQAAACLSLATYLKMAKENSERRLILIALQGDRSLTRESLAELNWLKERGLDKVAAESEALFGRAIQQYSDVQLEDNYPPEAGTFAKGQLFELRNLSIGKQAPKLEGTDVSGASLKLSDYRGKVVVLDFGSHRSCGVCRQMYPQLRSLVEQFEGQPFGLIGVNVADDLDELKELSSEEEMTWRVVWDGDAAEGPTCSQWAIQSMPTIYVIDQAGVIRNKGFLQGYELIGTVQKLLKEMAVAKP